MSTLENELEKKASVQEESRGCFERNRAEESGHSWNCDVKEAFVPTPQFT